MIKTSIFFLNKKRPQLAIIIANGYVNPYKTLVIDKFYKLLDLFLIIEYIKKQYNIIQIQNTQYI